MKLVSKIALQCLLISALSAPVIANPLKVKHLGTYGLANYKKGAAEIVAYHVLSQRLFVTNSADNTIDILNIRDPRNIKKFTSISLKQYGKSPNSVAAGKDIIAVAMENANKQKPGSVIIFDKDGKYKTSVIVGDLPDMVAITPNQKYILVANEGEPSKDYKIDPEGTVSIIKISDMSVRTVSFSHLTKKDFGVGAHFPSPKGTTLGQDVEPEYITVSDDSLRAYVSLQENNSIAVLDIENAKLKKVFGLGYKDYSKNPIDVNDKDLKTELKKWPIRGLFQPDGIATFKYEGKQFIVTANEGDSRDYPGYSEEVRVKKLKLDPKVFPNAKELQSEKNLGRLKATKAHGDFNNDGLIEQITVFGGRSFSIFSADGKMIFDSGSQFSEILSKKYPTWFNSQGQEKNFDNRSDDKGIEPEGVALGKINGNLYAFIGLERMGGIMVYDITDPYNPKYNTYFHHSNPKGDVKKKSAGDVAPEGIIFIDKASSPTGRSLIVTANEKSGTTTIFQVE